MFSIGEFSRVTGLSVKTLRFYHEKGVLVPSCVGEDSGYRYYDRKCVEKARIVVQLRDMEFPLGEIREILDHYEDEADILEWLERQKWTLEGRIQRYREITGLLERIVRKEREAKATMETSEFTVQEKVLEPMLIAGVRMKGKYSDCGKGFAKLGKQLGRYACGKAFCLYYDGEYRENDADLKACIPLRTRKEAPGIGVRDLSGGRCVSLLHRGPYEELSRSYEKILSYVKEKGYRIVLPTREVYLKGPGMIFRGNPKNYLTEIQMLLEE